MVKAVQGTVFWNVNQVLPEAMAEVYPKKLPPLRSDRDSIVVGVLKNREVQDVKIIKDNYCCGVTGNDNGFTSVYLCSKNDRSIDISGTWFNFTALRCANLHPSSKRIV